MMKYLHVLACGLVLVFCLSCRQNKTLGTTILINANNKGVVTEVGPQWITRNMIQDRKGDIWIAAFDGIFKYDGKSFTNVTSKITSARFFSMMEDRKGKLWFGAIGAGVYCYDGKSFRNFTTKDGLLGNAIGWMYEDRKGDIWFGGAEGASRYDGQSFRNYLLAGNAMQEEVRAQAVRKKHRYGVSSIIEDRKGGFWFAADGVFRYDGKSFTPFTHDGKAFKNVRSMIEDREGNIWLGGADGLWRYDGSKFTRFTERFVGRVMEDRKGNIWISSGKNSDQDWTLSRYEWDRLADETPRATILVHTKMVFGTLEDGEGNIWFGDFDGVHRYDGKTITDFKSVARTK